MALSQFWNPVENKKMVSLFFFSFFPPFLLLSIPPYFVSTLYFQNIKIHTPTIHFLFAHPPAPLEQWNDNEDKNCASEGTLDLLCVGGVCPLYPKCMSHHSPFCFVFFLFFLTTKARFANIFEIKCNCFLKLNQQKELERYNLIFLNITFKN